MKHLPETSLRCGVYPCDTIDSIYKTTTNMKMLQTKQKKKQTSRHSKAIPQIKTDTKNAEANPKIPTETRKKVNAMNEISIICPIYSESWKLHSHPSY